MQLPSSPKCSLPMYAVPRFVKAVCAKHQSNEGCVLQTSKEVSGMQRRHAQCGMSTAALRELCCFILLNCSFARAVLLHSSKLQLCASCAASLFVNAKFRFKVRLLDGRDYAKGSAKSACPSERIHGRRHTHVHDCMNTLIYLCSNMPD
jgi:hypothetical protein